MNQRRCAYYTSFVCTSPPGGTQNAPLKLALKTEGVDRTKQCQMRKQAVVPLQQSIEDRAQGGPQQKALYLDRPQELCSGDKASHCDRAPAQQ
mmetsp:Transcript_8385/g.24921  ORF Transcript_8385/g.24921 Transcript_8385/m.24921 type:complete len:93 (+) Transcript_8385:3005-3283(+)